MFWSLGDQIFVSVTVLGVGRPNLPHAVRDPDHRKIRLIPEVKIAYHMDDLCAGRPDPEDKAGLSVPGFGMTAQKVVDSNGGAAMISRQEVL